MEHGVMLTKDEFAELIEFKVKYEIELTSDYWYKKYSEACEQIEKLTEKLDAITEEVEEVMAC